jgi:hypothetical protein
MKQGSELLFEGKIPAEFSIVDSDVTAVKAPIPYYVSTTASLTPYT